MRGDPGCGRPRRRHDLPRRVVALMLCVLAAACGGDRTADPSGGATPATTARDTPSASAGDPATAGTASGAAAAAGAGPRNVSFRSGALELAGDLWLPPEAGPHPGVVLIHGSGPQDRDETVRGQLGMTFPQPVTVFADLARALRDAGYAVLTYDKRTCGPFNGCADNGYPQPSADLTVTAFISDASAAVEHLRGQDAVDGDAVAIVGHSQGASFVPAMLIDDPTLAAGVLLAAPHDPLDQVLLAQDEGYADVAALRTEDVAGGTMIHGASADFWRSWLRVTDGVPQLATQVEQPLLVLGGALDANVPPAQLEAWRRTMDGVDHARVVEIECVTHALNCVAADDLSTVAPEDVGGEVAGSVSDTIVEFLDGALR